MFLPCNILELILCTAESVMHYRDTAWTKNGKKTIVRKDGNTSQLGNTVGLSQVTNYKFNYRMIGKTSHAYRSYNLFIYQHAGSTFRNFWSFFVKLI